MEDQFGVPASPDTLPQGLNGEARERVASIMREARVSQGENRGESNKVTSIICEGIREMYEQGVPVKEITKQVPVSSHNSVYYHINGECSHEYRVQLTYSECGWMRVKAQKGKSSKELSEEYNLSQDVTTRHIVGKCDHEDGIEPLDSQLLRANAYDGPATTTSTCPVCENKFEHEEYRDRTTCSPECNVVYASMKSKESRFAGD